MARARWYGALALGVLLLFLMPVAASGDPITYYPPDPVTPEAPWALPVGLAIAAATAVLFEVAVAALAGLRGMRLAGVSVLNVLTNVPLNILLLSWDTPSDPAWFAIAALEIIVVCVEFGFLLWLLRGRGWSALKTLALSVQMNVVSFAGGILVFSTLPLAVQHLQWSA